MISFLKYLFLAIVQGFTEPIPISSSGHLVIFKHLISSEALNDLNLEIILNFGSLIAIIIFFWKDIKELILYFNYYWYNSCWIIRIITKRFYRKSF